MSVYPKGVAGYGTRTEGHLVGTSEARAEAAEVLTQPTGKTGREEGYLEGCAWSLWIANGGKYSWIYENIHSMNIDL